MGLLNGIFRKLGGPRGVFQQGLKIPNFWENRGPFRGKISPKLGGTPEGGKFPPKKGAPEKIFGGAPRFHKRFCRGGGFSRPTKRNRSQKPFFGEGLFPPHNSRGRIPPRGGNFGGKKVLPPHGGVGKKKFFSPPKKKMGVCGGSPRACNI